MNSPRCMAAQNRCTTSVTIRSEIPRHRRLRSPPPRSTSPSPTHTPRRRIGQRADRRRRLALGLGLATTGALLNHGGRTGQEVPRSAGCCDHRENPRIGLRTRSDVVRGSSCASSADLSSARSGAGPAGCRMRVLTPKRSLPESRANRRSRFPRSPRRRASRRRTYVVIPSRPGPSVGGVSSFCLRIRTATGQPFAPRDSVAPECSW